MTSKLLRSFFLLALFGAAGAHGEVTDYAFGVFLDDMRIGTHAFRVRDDGEGGRTVDIEAEFDVRILFVPVYRYRHSNAERWEDGCLVSLRSRTDDNGRDFVVSAARGEGALRVEGDAGATEVEGCASSFAYWDRSFLEATTLLNSQDGSLVPVEVEALGSEPFRVGDVAVAAERWRLTAPEGLDISLWYTPEGTWLGLETVRDGRVVRYEPEAEVLSLLGSGS